jgi:hypothetical protein
MANPTQLTKEQQAELLATPEPSHWRDNLVASFNRLVQDFGDLKLKYLGSPEITFELAKFESSLGAVSQNVTAVRDGALSRVTAPTVAPKMVPTQARPEGPLTPIVEPQPPVKQVNK